MGMLGCTQLCNTLQEFCGISYTSEQNVELRVSRQARDNSDCNKLITFFNTHSPFPSVPHLMSIFSGAVGDKKAN